MRRTGNIWGNAAMEHSFPSSKSERKPARLRIRDEAFEYGERRYNPRRRYSKLGCLGTMEFEAGVMPT
ncbi:MAG: hypothetical protein WBP18_08530 [Paracoccaceae bacterium]